MSSAASAAYHVEAVVVGAGVIGLAVARALAVNGREVLLLERAASFGSETSARNSEVIHAGLYYPSSSLKAKTCVSGRHMLYEYCEARHIPYQRCGKLVVAAHEKQMREDLESVKKRAEANGVTDIELWSRDQVQAIEPQVECAGALWSPSTGVFDSHTFMVNLLGDAEENGATLALNSAVNSGSIAEDGRIRLMVDDMELTCDKMVNCAGLWADELARRIRMPASSSSWKPPQQYFAKGNYFRLEGIKAPFRHLIYPLPDAAGGLGVHATLDWSQQSIKFGPDVEWLDPTIKPGEIDLRPDGTRAEEFYNAIRTYWPQLPDDSLVPDYAGVRPKLHHPQLDNEKSEFVDFRIDTEHNHGVPGLIHLFGMESPGLTASMSISEHVVQLLFND